MKLTSKQFRAADALREIRPEVIPGIQDDKVRLQRFEQWCNFVVSVMEWNAVTADQTHDFCNRAGVPE